MNADKFETLMEEEEFEEPRKKKMKNNHNNKRRFSDEQIRSLESIFEEETKLEPQKKVQLARELGLQPRQVAIWFQNRRARWKSKQLEREYNALRADYEALASNFELLKEEKQCLLKQLQKLGDLLEKHPEENRCCQSGGSSSNSGSDQADNAANCQEHEENLLPERESDLRVVVNFSGENGRCIDKFGPSEAELQSSEVVDGSLTLPEWSEFDSGCLPDPSSNGLQWWDLWH